MIKDIITVLLVLSIVVPIGVYVVSGKKHGKKVLLSNIVSFFGVLLVGTIFMFSSTPVFAADAGSTAEGMKFLAAALVTGLACIGSGIAVAAASSAALGALSENEGIMGKALIFVALAEGIALYGLLVSFTILGG